MLVVGLTGGIGSGKTAVSDAFARLGVPVIDTDVLARDVVSLGQPALREIVAVFGPHCLDEQGQLNRRYLRKAIFTNGERRKRLEAILHPRIRQALKERLAALNTPYCLVVIPLLVETGMQSLVHRILVVDVPETLQFQRVMARDRVDEAQVQRILAAQATRQQRLAVADDVIENDGDLSALEVKVATLHRNYQALADQGNS